MKIMAEDYLLAGMPYIRIIGVDGKGIKFEFEKSDFIHENLDDAIDFFEEIAEQLKDLKYEDKSN